MNKTRRMLFRLFGPIERDVIELPRPALATEFSFPIWFRSLIIGFFAM